MIYWVNASDVWRGDEYGNSYLLWLQIHHLGVTLLLFQWTHGHLHLWFQVVLLLASKGVWSPVHLPVWLHATHSFWITLDLCNASSVHNRRIHPMCPPLLDVIPRAEWEWIGVCSHVRAGLSRLHPFWCKLYDWKYYEVENDRIIQPWQVLLLCS